MSSQIEDAFNEDTEVVARMLYARNRTPREPGWLDQDESIREQAIKDVRVVVRLYIDATSHCPWGRAVIEANQRATIDPEEPETGT